MCAARCEFDWFRTRYRGDRTNPLRISKRSNRRSTTKPEGCIRISMKRVLTF